jgi:acetate kinase
MEVDMVRNILVFNVGSSSIKYNLFENSNLIKSGYYERLKSKEDYEKAVQDILFMEDN